MYTWASAKIHQYIPSHWNAVPRLARLSKRHDPWVRHWSVTGPTGSQQLVTIDENQRSGWTPGCLEDSWCLSVGFSRISLKVWQVSSVTQRKKHPSISNILKGLRTMFQILILVKILGRFLNSNHFGQLQSRRRRGRANEQWWRFFFGHWRLLWQVPSGNWRWHLEIPLFKNI